MSDRDEDDALTEAVDRHRRRLRRARQGTDNPWRTVARVGALGWLIALPPVLGALLGHLLDRRFGGGITWALALMMLGLAVAGSVLWRSLAEAQQDNEPPEDDA